MAKVVSPERLFPHPNVNSLRGRKREYPWDEWLDGKCREFIHGEDYTEISASHFISAARKAAAVRGLQLETKVDSPTVCVFRAYKPGE